jgi:uncharacterized protein (DUF2267 family)
MSATCLGGFDKALQTTNTWLKEIAEHIGPDRQRCYHALSTVLPPRDRLTPDEAADLAVQLPMLVRGIYYDGYRPAGKPGRASARARSFCTGLLSIWNRRGLSEQTRRRARYSRSPTIISTPAKWRR